MIKKILIPTSGYGNEDHIIEYVARVFPFATFHVVNVIDAYNRGFQLTNLLDQELSKLAENAIEQAKKKFQDEGINNIETKILRGLASKTIVKYSRKNDIDLIATGVYNKKSTCSINQMGSTVKNIIAHSTIPVLTLTKDTDKSQIKNILFPTDGTRKTRWAKNFAILLSAHLHAKLEVLSALNDKKDEDLALKLLENIEWKASFLNVKVKKTIKKGEAINIILEQTKENDIIIMGCGRRFLFWQTIGHVTKTIACSSSIPVIFVRYFKKR